MLKNYILVAIRNMRRHKGYSFINIAGLAISLTCCILIMLWVQDELSYDRFHQNSHNIYRVVQVENKNGEAYREAMSPVPLGPVLVDELPETSDAVRLRFRHDRWPVKYGQQTFMEDGICFADQTVFSMFSFPLLYGNQESALSDLYSVVISDEVREKYFGDRNPIGSVITMGNRYDFTITGVLENIPHNSHLKFNFLIPFALMEEWGRPANVWGDVSYYTYVMLPDRMPLEPVNKKINECLEKHYPESNGLYGLQPLEDIHLHSSDLAWDISGHGDITYVYVFSLLAVFIIIIACVNFMNLVTARSSLRAREIGVRKAIGARRSNIMRQFLGESLLFSMVALMLALVLVELLGPQFEAVSGKDGVLSLSGNTTIILSAFVVALFAGLSAGSYPALLLSNYQPVQTLCGLKRLSKSAVGFRKGLVVFQFTLSVMLILGTLFVSGQLEYMRDKNLGFSKENVLYIESNHDLNSKQEAVSSELLRNPRVSGVTWAASLPTCGRMGSTDGFEWEGKRDDQSIFMNVEGVGYDYFDVLDINVVAGRSFSREFPADTINVILNEAAVRAADMDSPLGKRFTFEDDGVVVGVVEDYHFKSLHSEIEPLVFWLRPGRGDYILIRISSEDIPGTIADIEKTCEEFAPGSPIECTFLDDAYDTLYKSEQRVGTIFRHAAIIAILISCLGLFGLAAYMAEQRTKEIGIRKVLGASVSSVVCLLSREFVVLVAVANVIAWPIAYYAGKSWLDNFAYRIDVTWDTFAIAGVLALVVALATVSYQAIRAARANPVDALKYE